MLKDILKIFSNPKICDYCGQKLCGFGLLSIDSRSWICDKCALEEKESNKILMNMPKSRI